MDKIPPRIETIRKFKEKGGRIAAVLPIHYSRSLLRAFNILPVEVWGPPQIGAGKSSTHLQAYVCSICHNALSYLEQGGLDLADLLLVPHACDSLQGLGSMLLNFVKPSQPVIPLYIPRNKGQSDLDFFAAEFRSLYQRLAEITGLAPNDDDLLASITREEAADEMLKELHQNLLHLPFSNVAAYKTIRSREYLPAEEFTQIAKDALSQVQDTPRNGTPIILEGIVPEPMTIFETLSDLDAVVVGDDLASCGRRLYSAGTSLDPFLRMAERILYASPDPMRGNSLTERREFLLEMANRTEAEGIIFYLVKFCEPELFDLPILRQGLREANIPSFVIKMDLNSPLSQQMHTRLEAFLEMLQ